MSEIQSEQTFGRESVEKSLGYMPAVVDMPKDGPMDSNFEPSSDRLTEGAKEEDVHDQNNLSNPVATSIVRQEVARISSLIEKGPRSWPKKERVAFWFLPGNSYARR